MTTLDFLQPDTSARVQESQASQCMVMINSQEPKLMTEYLSETLQDDLLEYQKPFRTKLDQYHFKYSYLKVAFGESPENPLSRGRYYLCRPELFKGPGSSSEPLTGREPTWAPRVALQEVGAIPGGSDGPCMTKQEHFRATRSVPTSHRSERFQKPPTRLC